MKEAKKKFINLKE